MNHDNYIALLEAENARLKLALTTLRENNKLLDNRMKECIRRAFSRLPDSSHADRDAQYFADTLELIERVRAL